MTRGIGPLLAAVLVTTAIALSMQPTLVAAPPTTVTYQGRLTTSQGLPRQGPVDLNFRIYSQPTASPQAFVWGEEHDAVALGQGVFTVLLGAGARTLASDGTTSPGASPLDAAVFADGEARFLQVQVRGEAPLAPLIPLSSVPFSLNAQAAEALLEPATGDLVTLTELDGRYVGTGDSLVRSLNGVSADATGDFALTPGSSGNITITPTANGLEIDTLAGAPLDLATADARYVNVGGDTISSLQVTGSVTGQGQWLAAPVGATHGGTGQSSYQPGDLLYASSSGQLVRLGAGAQGQVLTMQGGVPTWSTPSSPPAQLAHFGRLDPGTTSFASGTLQVANVNFQPRVVLATLFDSAGVMHTPVAVFGSGGSPVGQSEFNTSFSLVGTQSSTFMRFSTGGVASVSWNGSTVQVNLPAGTQVAGWILVRG